MFYGNQSPCGQNCPTNIHGIQVDLPVATISNVAFALQRYMRMRNLFAPLKVLIKSLPGGPMVNLASPNEHIPEIK
jgi:hypothetical protein